MNAMSYAFTNMTLLSLHAHCSALVPDRPFKLPGRNAQSIFVVLYQANISCRHILLELQAADIISIPVKKRLRHKSDAKTVLHHRKYQVGCFDFDIRLKRQTVLGKKSL